SRRLNRSLPRSTIANPYLNQLVDRASADPHMDTEGIPIADCDLLLFSTSEDVQYAHWYYPLDSLFAASARATSSTRLANGSSKPSTTSAGSPSLRKSL